MRVNTKKALRYTRAICVLDVIIDRPSLALGDIMRSRKRVLSFDLHHFDQEQYDQLQLESKLIFMLICMRF